MILTGILSFIAGLLTVLAPCVLPLLPVILGGSLNPSDNQDKKRPYIIIVSLVISLILFTVLLKVSTVFIGVDPQVWTIGSGILVIILGLFMLFPNVWAKFVGKGDVESKSQLLLNKAFKNKNRVLGAVLIGAALGPVFSSCSPTYLWVVATVIPSNAVEGFIYLIVYCVGVGISLLGVALLGRKLLNKIKWASDPRGLFQKGIAILFILVGVFVITGLDKKIQTYLVEKDVLNLIEIEKNLVPEDSSIN